MIPPSDEDMRADTPPHTWHWVTCPKCEQEVESYNIHECYHCTKYMCPSCLVDHEDTHLIDMEEGE